MASKFWKLVREACLKSSVLGFKYLYLYTDRFSRLFWAASIALTFLAACALMLLLWSRFMELPTRITIANQFSPIYDIPFPAVALCTPNQVARSRVAHLNRTLIDGDMAVDLHKALPYLMGLYEQITPGDERLLPDLQHLLQLNRYEIREVVSYLPQPCTAFLRACYWEGERADCVALFRPVLTERGMCCGFNAAYGVLKNRVVHDRDHEPKKARFFGAELGLSVVTDYEPTDSLPGTLLNEGATQLLFHDPREFPNLEERTMVPPHVESYHVIQATVTNCSDDVAALPIESRRCVFEDEYNLKYFWKYRNSQCDIDCYLRKLEAACSCVMVFAPLRGPLCDASSIPCIVHTRQVLAVDSSSFEACDCPRECLSRKYKIRSNLGNLRALSHIYHDQYEGIEFTNSTSILHIYYQTPFYVAQKQETVMSYINLISNLGGVFGLCLGCSVVSVLELLFFVYRALRGHSPLPRRRRRRPRAAVSTG